MFVQLNNKTTLVQDKTTHALLVFGSWEACLEWLQGWCLYQCQRKSIPCPDGAGQQRVPMDVLIAVQHQELDVMTVHASASEA